MTDRGLPYPFLHRPEGALLDLSLHYPRHLLDRLQHFAPFPPQPLHIKRERRDSTPHTPFLQGVKQEPGEEGEGQDLSYHREEQYGGERELPRSFSLPAPREPGHAPERQVSLEGGREGGAPPKPEASSRTVIGRPGGGGGTRGGGGRAGRGWLPL